MQEAKSTYTLKKQILGEIIVYEPVATAPVVVPEASVNNGSNDCASGEAIKSDNGCVTPITSFTLIIPVIDSTKTAKLFPFGLVILFCCDLVTFAIFYIFIFLKV